MINIDVKGVTKSTTNVDKKKSNQLIIKNHNFNTCHTKITHSRKLSSKKLSMYKITFLFSWVFHLKKHSHI